MCSAATATIAANPTPNPPAPAANRVTAIKNNQPISTADPTCCSPITNPAAKPPPLLPPATANATDQKYNFPAGSANNVNTTTSASASGANLKNNRGAFVFAAFSIVPAIMFPTARLFVVPMSNLKVME